MGLDRRRQLIDVLERVLGAAQEHDGPPRTDVIELDIRAGLVTAVTSVTQMAALGRDRGRDG
jgi:hypothetical protein